MYPFYVSGQICTLLHFCLFIFCFVIIPLLEQTLVTGYEEDEDSFEYTVKTPRPIIKWVKLTQVKNRKSLLIKPQKPKNYVGLNFGRRFRRA